MDAGNGTLISIAAPHAVFQAPRLTTTIPHLGKSVNHSASLENVEGLWLQVWQTQSPPGPAANGPRIDRRRVRRPSAVPFRHHVASPSPPFMVFVCRLMFSVLPPP